MAYPIGSISKQFTATAMLMLQQQGKLSLEDPVSKFFPELTRSHDVKIINLLTHTSGYQDYAPAGLHHPCLEASRRPAGDRRTSSPASRSTSTPAPSGSTPTPTSSSPR